MEEHVCLSCVEPDKIPCRFFYPQIKTFHGPILRARDQQKSVRGVKANFIDCSSVIVKDVLLFRSGLLIEIPHNHGTVCGCCCQYIVCSEKHEIELINQKIKWCNYFTIKGVPDNIIAGEV